MTCRSSRWCASRSGGSTGRASVSSASPGGPPSLALAGGALRLLLSSVLPLAGALAVRLTSPGPIFYRQVRIGRDRRPFTLWKLRTMRVDAEAQGDEVLAQEGDPRLTPLGAFLRRTRLDEIPQLGNVLAGSMSLVGPRPE